MILRETASVNGIIASVHEQTSLPTFTVLANSLHFWHQSGLTVIPLLSQNPIAFYALCKSSPAETETVIETLKRVNRKVGNVAALVRSHKNGLKSFKRTIEQTIETKTPSPNNSCCNDAK